MKNFAADIDANGNLIRIHTPSTLTTQDTYKSARADMIKKQVEAEDSTDPIISEIFRLFYITPTEANKTINYNSPLTEANIPNFTNCTH